MHAFRLRILPIFLLFLRFVILTTLILITPLFLIVLLKKRGVISDLRFNVDFAEPWNKEELIDAQKNDESMGEMYRWFTSSPTRPDWKNVSGKGATIKHYWNE